MSDVTRMLEAIERGDARAVDSLLPAVYQELRQLAARKLASEKPGQTLQPTALVHEVYLRLVGTTGENWSSRTHFFTAAAEAMRRILVENARRKRSLKRGGERRRANLEDWDLAFEEPSEDLLALDEALRSLTRTDKLKADIIKLRYFAGLTLEQAADVLGVSPRTAKRHWRYARAWLYKQMNPDR